MSVEKYMERVRAAFPTVFHPTQERIAALCAAVEAETREACAKTADKWLSPQEMRLRAGEMTAQEHRTARAIVSAIAAAIRAGKP